MAKDPLKYWEADEVDEIALDLINKFHPHLAGESIIYLFRSEHAESNGKIELGKAKRIGGLNAYLANRHDLEQQNDAGDNPAEKQVAEPIKLIEIAFDVWQQLNTKQREALVDHELMHFAADGGMRGHDLEEFRAIVDRHGLWRPEIELFAQTIAQQKLFPSTEDLARMDHGQAIADHLVNEAKKPNSKVAKALRPKKGSHLTKVTIRSGRKSVTLRPRD